MAEDRILEILTGPHPRDSRESFRQLLRDGALDDRSIEVEVTQKAGNDKVRGRFCRGRCACAEGGDENDKDDEHDGDDGTSLTSHEQPPSPPYRSFSRRGAPPCCVHRAV